VNVQLDPDEDPARLRIFEERGQSLPRSARGRRLRFYSGSPGTVRIAGGRGERVYSLTLPEVADTEWSPPKGTAEGLPPRWSEPLSRDLWQWLAALGGICLLIEWMLYGRMRAAMRAVVAMPGRLFAGRVAS
jgi:hypothetical protein